MPKRTRSDSSTRIRQILDAARDSLTTGGLESVKIARLAEEIGLSEAALYRHVNGKEEILALVIDDVRQTLFNGIETASTPDDKPALRKLEHLLRLHLTWMKGSHGVCLMLVTEALQFGDGKVSCESRKLIDDYTSRVATIIEDGKLQGEIEQGVNPDTAATMFIGMEKAAVGRRVLDPDEKRCASEVDGLWRMYRSSIEAVPQAV